MSYLEQLLEGVEMEWKPLEEIAKFRRGSFPQPYGNREWYDGDGAMPFVQVVDVGNDLRLVNESKNKISKLAQPRSIFVPEGTVIVTLQGTIGRVAITQYDSYVDRTLAIFTGYHFEIDKKYFAYQLEEKFRIEKEFARGSTIKTITKEEFKKFQIPIPPLSVQKEIVRILDTFTGLTEELKTELIARKKQFTHYRDQLLSFEGQDVEWKPLGEIGKFQRGKRFVKTDMISKGIPCIHYGEMYTYFGPYALKTKSFVSAKLVKNKKLRTAEKNDVVLVGAGETIEDIGIGTAWLGEEGAVTHDACFSFRSKLNPKYVAYFTRTVLFHNQIKRHIRTGKISAINEKGLGKAKIPVPSEKEQERIVTIFDKFDTLTTSKNEGLPAEIEMRQKQYEYYRDQLLTFPKPKD